MLIIKIPSRRLWDGTKEEFVYSNEHVLKLEHSLVSISKWESMYHKPFLSEEQKSKKETLDYIKCMTMTQNVKDEVYASIDLKTRKVINDYIENKMTATWFSKPVEKSNKPQKKEVITSELIYYWMIAAEIPFECQKWHLNRLLTLIKVCSAKNKAATKGNKKPTKGDRKKTLQRNSSVNAARRKAMNTSG